MINIYGSRTDMELRVWRSRALATCAVRSHKFAEPKEFKHARTVEHKEFPRTAKNKIKIGFYYNAVGDESI